MKKILVTGSNGFMGKNLIETLARNENISYFGYDLDKPKEELKKYLKEADIIFHFAGVNRPVDVKEFEEGNTAFTKEMLEDLKKSGNTATVVFISSIQVHLENPYGVSKKKAEDLLIEYGKKNKAKVYLYRLTNVFGKWSRPNYNSVVATFCHNVSRGIEIKISDPQKQMEFNYIDDVIAEFTAIIDKDDKDTENYYYDVKPVYRIKLKDLAETIEGFRKTRENLRVPDMSDKLTKYLYATYLSYLEKDDFKYKLDMKTDQRGMLAELLKSENSGQIFVSKTHKGITRGNHYHNTKVEKFCVIQGKAVIRFRNVLSKDVIEYMVSGEKIEIVDIPPGYTHSIRNTGEGEMIVLFWASEIFNADNPDTYFKEV
ncbi:MAG: NAD-dependent epimerase/dehydratase family protein [Endomicrobiales bacterium]|nr:NAD-dependent epimerase/dehydratase family protein [Endomicrobiales bacterium]